MTRSFTAGYSVPRSIRQAGTMCKPLLNY